MAIFKLIMVVDIEQHARKINGIIFDEASYHKGDVDRYARNIHIKLQRIDV